MTGRQTLLATSFAVLVGSLATAVAQQPSAPTDSAQTAAVTAATDTTPSAAAHPPSPSANSHDALVHDARIERLEGEQRFHTNCGRCHVAPPRFPPRVMATVLRHMRVRALLTDEDRRLILRYMTQ